MKTEKKLSVIIPVYNVADYLERCVASVRAQQYQNLEIILVDDASTDESGALCDRLQTEDQRIQVIHQPHGGLVRARKTGLQAATGEYATYVDSDDWIEPEMYQELMRYAEEEVDVITSGAFRDYSEGNVVRERESIPAGVYRDNRTFSEKCLISEEHFFESKVSIHIWNKLYNTELLRQHQNAVPDEISLFEDAAVIYPILMHAKSVAVSGKEYYHYCIRPSSMMGVWDRSDREKILSAQQYLRPIFEEAALHKQYRALAAFMMMVRCPEEEMSYEKGVLRPYGKVTEQERLLILGKGRFGKQLYRWVQEHTGLMIAAWTDRSDEDYEEVLKGSYDKILIAAVNYGVIRSMLGELDKRGIGRDMVKIPNPLS